MQRDAEMSFEIINGKVKSMGVNVVFDDNDLVLRQGFLSLLEKLPLVQALVEKHDQGAGRNGFGKACHVLHILGVTLEDVAHLASLVTVWQVWKDGLLSSCPLDRWHP